MCFLISLQSQTSRPHRTNQNRGSRFNIFKFVLARFFSTQSHVSFTRIHTPCPTPHRSSFDACINITHSKCVCVKSNLHNPEWSNSVCQREHRALSGRTWCVCKCVCVIEISFAIDARARGRAVQQPRQQQQKRAAARDSGNGNYPLTPLSAVCAR